MTFDVVSLPHASLHRRCFGCEATKKCCHCIMAVCLADGHINFGHVYRKMVVVAWMERWWPTDRAKD